MNNPTTGESLLDRSLEFQGNEYRPGQGELSVRLSQTIDHCLVGRVSWVGSQGHASIIVALRALREGIVDLAGQPIPTDRWIADYCGTASVTDLKSLEQNRTDLLTDAMLVALNDAATELLTRLQRKESS